MNKRHGPHDERDNKALMAAIAISLCILLGFHFGYERPRQDARAVASAQQKAAQKAAQPDVAMSKPEPVSRQDVVAQGPRVPIKGDMVTGSISLTGARIDDLTLNAHKATNSEENNVTLLSPSGTNHAYYVESGWASADKSAKMPDSKSVWHLSPDSAPELVSGGEIELQWDNGQGLLFKRRIALDKNYLFTVTQKVLNKSDATQTLSPWHLISRHGLPPDFKGFFILHEGPVSYLNGALEEPQYKDIAKGESFATEHAQGWLGITDKYWLVALLPPADAHFDARITGDRSSGAQLYQTDIVSSAKTAAPGQEIEDVQYVFAGVKNLPLINGYIKAHQFDRLDLAFDFGMWYFITKPFFLLLHFLIHTIGNVGLAILAMTVLVRSAVFPLASKSFRSMAKMKIVAPQLKELQEKYGSDRQKLQAEIFDLYRREDVNPFSGCWPILIQIPIFFALYKSILMSVELRHAPFWGWIHDLSAPDHTNIFTLFGLIPWTPPTFLTLGGWPALFCITMLLQKRMSPPLPDKTQEQLQTWFPFIITFMLSQFAAGLVIYWTWSNILGILQQYYIMRSFGGEDVSLLRGHAGRRKKKNPKPAHE